jgi:hypothetical protein
MHNESPPELNERPHSQALGFVIGIMVTLAIVIAWAAYSAHAGFCP